MSTLSQTKQNRLAKLSEIQALTKKLVVDAGSVKGKIANAVEVRKLNSKSSTVIRRLKGYMTQAKMSPTEFQNMSAKMKRLALLSDDALDLVMESYESREPVVKTRQIGSLASLEVGSEVVQNLEKRQVNTMKADIKGSFKRMNKDLKFKGGDESEDKEMSFEEKVAAHKDEKELAAKDEEKKSPVDMKACLEEVKKCLESGDVDGAKKHLADSEKCLDAEPSESVEMKKLEGAEQSEDEQKDMGDMEARVDELSTQMARIAGMVEELMSVEKEEGHEELAAEEAPGEEKKELADQKDVDDEKKELKGDDAEEDKKDLGAEEDKKEKDLSFEDKVKEKELANGKDAEDEKLKK